MLQCQKCAQLNPPESLYCGRCGIQLMVADGTSGQLPAGSMLGSDRFQVIESLGGGAMGQVYKARDTRLEREVALKVLHAGLISHPTARQRMAREARALARITHPNVVQITDVFDEGSSLVLVLELVRGGSLEEKMAGQGWDVERAVTVMEKVLSGLGAIHEAGLIHRDIKPANILMDVDGITPKVTDLGIAHDDYEASMTLAGARLGTPEYMSPEQIKGRAVDLRSDIYSCGIVLYELLAGKVPFAGGSEYDVAKGHVEMEPEWACINVPPHVLVALQSALAKSPAERWDSTSAFIAGLRGESSPVKRAPTSVPVVPAPTTRKTKDVDAERFQEATPSSALEDLDLDSFARNLRRRRWARIVVFMVVLSAVAYAGVSYINSPAMVMRGEWESVKKRRPVIVTITDKTLWIEDTKREKTKKFTYEIRKSKDDKVYLDIEDEDGEEHEIVIEVRKKKLIIWDEDEDNKLFKLVRAD